MRDSPIRTVTPKVDIERQGDRLNIWKKRSWRGFSVLMIVLCTLFILALSVALIESTRHDELGRIGCIIAMGAAAYAILLYSHLLRFNVDIALGVGKDRITLNDRWLALGDASHVILVASANSYSGWRYTVCIQDKSKYNRLLLAWRTEKEVADEICRFLRNAGLRTERVETSWAHRPSDLRWGPGLWKRT